MGNWRNLFGLLRTLSVSSYFRRIGKYFFVTSGLAYYNHDNSGEIDFMLSCFNYKNACEILMFLARFGWLMFDRIF